MHPSIKVDLRYSEEKMDFLDVTTYFKDGKIETDLFCKPSDKHLYLHVKSDHPETVKRAIEINAGIAILPASTVVTESERKQLVTYKLEGGMHNRPLAIIHKKSRLLTPALRSFVELMKNKPPESD